MAVFEEVGKGMTGIEETVRLARKALGNETDRPTLTLDIGSLMGSLVGQTESNIRQALKIADAMQPSVLIAHLTERLTGQTDGRPKVFRGSAVNNLTEFFRRFRELNVRSNDELDGLVEQPTGPRPAN